MHLFMKVIRLLYLIVLTTNIGYSQVELFDDLNKLEEGSYPTTFIELNNLTFFVVKERTNYFLYKTDGTEENTELVNVQPIDFPQFQQSSRDNLFLENGYVFYITQRLKNDGTVSEMWRTNEDENVKIGELGYYSRILGFIDNLPIFSTTNQILKLDENGNKIVLMNESNLSNYLANNYPSQKLRNELFFFTFYAQGTSKSKLWKTNGVDSGTTLIGEIDSLAGNFIQENINIKLSYKLGDAIYFILDRAIFIGNTIFKKDLYKYENGLLAKVKTIELNNNGGFRKVRNITNLGQNLIFISENRDSQIWLSDGTESGTKLIKTLNTVEERDGKFWGKANGKLFFNGSETFDYELWQTDGTSENTVLFKSFNDLGNTYLSKFFNFENRFLFKTDKNEMWFSDGSIQNTTMIGKLADFYGRTGFDDSFNMSFNSNSSKFHFNYYSDSTGFEPFKMSIVDKEITLIKDINKSTKSFVNATFKTRLNDFWYFSGVDNDSSIVIYKTDGTLAGTVSLKTNGGKYYVYGMVNSEDKIFVNLRLINADGVFRRIGVIYPDSDSLKLVRIAPQNEIVNFQPQNFSALGSKIIFNANGRSVWVSDGTTQGTFLLLTFGNSLSSFYSFGGKVYFMVQSSLWATDGTISGTVQISNYLNRNSPLSAFNHFTLNDKMYFLGSFYDDNVIQKLGLFEVNETASSSIVRVWFPSNYAMDDTYLNFSNTLSGSTIFPLNYRLIGDKYLIDIWGFNGVNTTKVLTLEGIRKGVNGISTFGVSILNNKHILLVSKNS